MSCKEDNYATVDDDNVSQGLLRIPIDSMNPHRLLRHSAWTSRSKCIVDHLIGTNTTSLDGVCQQPIGHSGAYLCHVKADGYEPCQSTFFRADSLLQISSQNLTVRLRPRPAKCLLILTDMSRVPGGDMETIIGEYLEAIIKAQEHQ